MVDGGREIGTAMNVRLAMTFGLAIPALASAQASLRGRVLTDSTERPIAGAVVAIEQLKIQSTTDSLGRFTLTGIEPGDYVVTAKRIGFNLAGATMRFSAREAYSAEFMLAQTLADVRVETKAAVRGKLAEFEERRAAHNGGRFMTQADFEKRGAGTLSDAMRQVSGMEFYPVPGTTNVIIAVTGRMSVPGGSLMKGQASAPCPAAVAVDGAMVYTGTMGEPKFNLNTFDPSSLAGAEFYAGPSTMPIKYNGTRNTCGLLLLWTK